MAKIDFNKITPNNGAVRELSELLFLKFFEEPNSLEKFCVWNTGVMQGDKVAGIGRFGPLGKRITKQCGNDYESSVVSTQQKTWDLGHWGIFEQLCVDDVIPTLIKRALKSGTDIADLTDGDYIDKILMPLLEDAIIKLLWRLAWLGDKQAENVVVTRNGDKDVVSGGIITQGLKPELFNTCDGFFKRLTDITILAPERRVAIAANTATTKAEQKAQLRVPGTAQKLVDDVIDAMPMVLRQADNKAILVTQSVADALSLDINGGNRGSELQWETIFTGVDVAKYRGYDVYAIALWDEMFTDFHAVVGTDVNYVVNPHRVVATTLDNLKLGTMSSETLTTLKAWFDEKEDMNYIKAKDSIGTQIWQDDLCVYAY